MLEKLFSWLGYEKKDDFLFKENLRLRAENKALRGIELPFVSIEAEDPAPQDSEARLLYVARAAGFHHEVMRKKVIQIISQIRAQLGRLDSTMDSSGRSLTNYSPREFDLVLKGTENALWLIHDWGEEMVREQIANQTEPTTEEIDELKDKVIIT